MYMSIATFICIIIWTRSQLLKIVLSFTFTIYLKHEIRYLSTQKLKRWASKQVLDSQLLCFVHTCTDFFKNQDDHVNGNLHSYSKYYVINIFLDIIKWEESYPIFLGSKSSKLLSTGSPIVAICISEDKNRKIRDFAKTSPKQPLFPNPNAANLIQYLWSIMI